jgi:hypothetical protein
MKREEHETLAGTATKREELKGELLGDTKDECEGHKDTLPIGPLEDDGFPTREQAADALREAIQKAVQKAREDKKEACGDLKCNLKDDKQRRCVTIIFDEEITPKLGKWLFHYDDGGLTWGYIVPKDAKITSQCHCVKKKKGKKEEE